MSIHLKRAYDEPSDADGVRVLVDRLWPRGVAKDGARIDRWLKELAPSAALRKWYGHDPEKWDQFKARYFAELDGRPEGVDELRRLARKEQVTLVFGARDEQHSNAAALEEYLSRTGRGKSH